ncbi:hypothetical protein C8A03DRAFT_15968 [Achaetomium macrosporum]|uniref:Zn(2)-C6 fungal-type domain-containing protein n=1 Tax=Achaetomium macrosporum TaxID=79813 RepID=A0AAN7HBK6_9PEZI|nr:hypothetical protein C8A03DRAFT_15968 [Achaetomium macrosporum]
MVSQACYTTNDGRRYSRPYPLYFPAPTTERRFALSSRDGRTITIADQMDSDSTPQRKRIAVACGRCRKRKIRCSGDPGHGQPCSNCKNAGVEQCQFLRVSSREAHLRDGPGDFGYSVGDARVYASRTPVGGGMPYTQELPPTLGSSDVLGSYRGGSAYAYTPTAATARAYYPAMHAYGTPYGDDLEFGFGVSSPSMLSHEQTGILPGQWSSGAAAARQPRPPTFSSMYMDTTTPDGGPYNGYGGTAGGSLLHRPSSDSPNFSFSGVAASLPLSSTPGPDRALPNPTGRSSSTLPYPGLKPPTPAASSTSAVAAAASTLADVATAAANYAGGFDTTTAAYSTSASSSSSAAASGSSMSGTPPSVASRSNSDSYSDFATEPQDRGQAGSGSAFDTPMHSSYTAAAASPRRGSSSHAYGESADETAYHHHHSSVHSSVQHHHSHQHHHGGHHHHHHPHQHQHHQHHGLPYISDPAAAAHAHVDDRQVVAQAAVNAVAGRH